VELWLDGARREGGSPTRRSEAPKIVVAEARNQASCAHVLPSACAFHLCFSSSFAGRPAGATAGRNSGDFRLGEGHR
jgi:hypothetical protein